MDDGHLRAAASMALKMWPSSCIDTRRPNLAHECRQGAVTSPEPRHLATASEAVASTIGKKLVQLAQKRDRAVQRLQVCQGLARHVDLHAVLAAAEPMRWQVGLDLTSSGAPHRFSVPLTSNLHGRPAPCCYRCCLRRHLGNALGPDLVARIKPDLAGWATSFRDELEVDNCGVEKRCLGKYVSLLPKFLP